MSSGDEDAGSDNATRSKTKPRLKPKAKQSKPSEEGGVPSSGEESDGLTALKAVEEEGRGGVNRVHLPHLDYIGVHQQSTWNLVQRH